MAVEDGRLVGVVSELPINLTIEQLADFDCWQDILQGSFSLTDEGWRELGFDGCPDIKPYVKPE